MMKPRMNYFASTAPTLSDGSASETPIKLTKAGSGLILGLTVDDAKGLIESLTRCVAELAPKPPADINAKVATALAALGIPTTYEYPGFVRIAKGVHHCYATSDCNSTWTVDLQTANGEQVIWTKDTLISRACPDVDLIVDGILEILEFECTACGENFTAASNQEDIIDHRASFCSRECELNQEAYERTSGRI